MRKHAPLPSATAPGSALRTQSSGRLPGAARNRLAAVKLPIGFAKGDDSKTPERQRAVAKPEVNRWKINGRRGARSYIVASRRESLAVHSR